MIKNLTTGKTKFVQYSVNAPDGRFSSELHKGGITLQTALHEAKQLEVKDKRLIITIFEFISWCQT